MISIKSEVQELKKRAETKLLFSDPVTQRESFWYGYVRALRRVEKMLEDGHIPTIIEMEDDM